MSSLGGGAVVVEGQQAAQDFLLGNGDDPLLACLGGGRGIGFGGLNLALKDSPIVLGVGPGPNDFILNPNAAIKTEIGRTLPRGVFEPIQDVRGKGGPF
jgi:hypothetical protein